jgi:hypothetical protein
VGEKKNFGIAWSGASAEKPMSGTPRRSSTLGRRLAPRTSPHCAASDKFEPV